MASNHQSTEGLCADLGALIAWVQSMPKSALTIPSTNEQPTLVADFHRLKEQMAHLNAQVKTLSTVFNDLQAAVGRLDSYCHKQGPALLEKGRASSDETAPSDLRTSLLPAYVSALNALQDLSGRELQQLLRNFNLEWSGVGDEEMKREILKHSGFGDFITDLPT